MLPHNHQHQAFCFLDVRPVTLVRRVCQTRQVLKGLQTPKDHSLDRAFAAYLALLVWSGMKMKKIYILREREISEVNRDLKRKKKGAYFLQQRFQRNNGFYYRTYVHKHTYSASSKAMSSLSLLSLSCVAASMSASLSSSAFTDAFAQ